LLPLFKKRSKKFAIFIREVNGMEEKKAKAYKFSILTSVINIVVTGLIMQFLECWQLVWHLL
jgi:hypothetical protein